VQQSYGGVDDRKTLGPIGTERAARRPPHVAPSMYAADVNMAAAAPLQDTWNMYADGTCQQLILLSLLLHFVWWNQIPSIPTHSFVAWSVCHLSHPCPLLKPFDGFRCHLHLWGPVTHCVRWGYQISRTRDIWSSNH